MRVTSLVAILAILAAGCVAPADEPVAPPPTVARVESDAAPAPAETDTPEPPHETAPTHDLAPTHDPPPTPEWSFAWNGSRLAPQRHVPPAVCVMTLCPTNATCSSSNCERVRVDVPALHGRALEVLVRWPTVTGTRFQVAIESPDGGVLAAGRSSILSAHARLERAQPGAYVVAVTQSHGAPSTYQALARAEPAPPEGAGELLPDIVVLPPADLRIAAPDGAFPSAGKGCTPYEHADAKPRRCLRFSNAVGNAGDGPLEVRMPSASATGAANSSARFVQRIYDANGSFRDASAGFATFHPAHAHWHNAAVETYAAYALDASGARGGKVGEGRKAGICFADYGLISLDPPRVSSPRYDGVECVAPPSGSWILGLSAGWFDLYSWTLDDQYVDIGAAADGAYELCAVVNPDGALLDADTNNDEACTRFLLKGDGIELMDAAPYHEERGSPK